MFNTSLVNIAHRKSVEENFQFWWKQKIIYIKHMINERPLHCVSEICFASLFCCDFAEVDIAGNQFCFRLFLQIHAAALCRCIFGNRTAAHRYFRLLAVNSTATVYAVVTGNNAAVDGERCSYAYYYCVAGSVWDKTRITANIEWDNPFNDVDKWQRFVWSWR